MDWTDAELVKQEAICRTSAAADFADLYRLARLGLAAEQVGYSLEVVADAVPVDWDSTVAVRSFLNHTAWRKP